MKNYSCRDVKAKVPRKLNVFLRLFKVSQKTLHFLADSLYCLLSNDFITRTKGNSLIMKKTKQLFTQYKHAIPLFIYGAIYLSWFSWLEQKVTTHYHVIHMAIDDHIPFCEAFIIPYFLWFVYVAAVVVFFFFKNKTDYYKNCIFLFTGMTIFLIVSTLWPNGHHLRPVVMPRDNIFTYLVDSLYHIDTATNLWPSIHVYNSIGAHLAITHSKEFENKRGIRILSLILAVSIILSTMFLKQHSVFDVLTAFVMATVMYLLVYRFDLIMAIRTGLDKRRAKPQIG